SAAFLRVGAMTGAFGSRAGSGVLAFSPCFSASFSLSLFFSASALGFVVGSAWASAVVRPVLPSTETGGTVVLVVVIGLDVVVRVGVAVGVSDGLSVMVMSIGLSCVGGMF